MELSSKVVKLDFDYILRNCHLPWFWKKSWSIFQYGEFEIKFALSAINIEDNKLTYKTELYKKGELVMTDRWNGINMDEANRNIQVITKTFNGTIYRYLLKSYEAGLIGKTSAYINAKKLQDSKVELAEAKAIQKLDSLEIKDKKIRKAYVDRQKQNASTSEYVNEVLEQYEGTMIPQLYLSYALFTNEKERYTQYCGMSELNEEAIATLSVNIQEQLDKIEQGTMDIVLEDDIENKEEE